jgi:NAD(P)H-hydrate epimerase
MTVPDFAHLREIHTMIAKTHRHKKMYYHCKGGFDRTGVVTATFFIFQGKTPAQAKQMYIQTVPDKIRTVFEAMMAITMPLTVQYNSMQTLSGQQSRSVDQLAIAEFGMSRLFLMENAGRGVADLMERLGLKRTSRIVICCGKGNNGGDGFVLARHLLVRNYQPTVLLFADPAELTGDALTNYRILQSLKFPVHLSCDDTLTECFAQLSGDDWIVDALLGTGATGNPRPPMDDIIRRMNQVRQQSSCRMLAIDLPSGWDADIGQISAPTIHATETATFFSMKNGFDCPAAKEYLGAVHVLDIGIPSSPIIESLSVKRFR